MKKIYVGNLPYHVVEADLEAIFNKFGGIVSVKLIQDFDTGRSKGFGFVEFQTQSQAQAALEMNGRDFEGRPLKISIAREQQRAGGGGGGGRKSGGGNGGGGRRW